MNGEEGERQRANPKIRRPWGLVCRREDELRVVGMDELPWLVQPCEFGWTACQEGWAVCRPRMQCCGEEVWRLAGHRKGGLKKNGEITIIHRGRDGACATMENESATTMLLV
jgi:hypothetical protein